MSEAIPKIPNLDLVQLEFLIANNLGDKSTLEKLLKGIKADKMASYYAHVVAALKIPNDAALVESMNTANKKILAELEAKIVDAEENLGETELSEALIAKAEHFSRIGDKENGLAAFNFAIDKTGPLGHRIDLNFAIIRIGFLYKDVEIISSTIDKVKVLIEEGGDWDRRNRLKVYEGIFLISKRDFKTAANLLLDTLGTFTSTEIMEYKDFVRYSVLTAALTLNRPDFKAKVVNAPEILEVVHEIPHLSEYANSFYNCQYAPFFKALAEIEQVLKTDHYLHAHYRFYVREMRIRVYGQLLESYRSLTIESMARSFGVSEEWIDNDIFQLISAGRLNAVIDKVKGIVESNRPDAKNAQYQASIKDGDILLNRIQKLSRVINV